jgi:hypothetical protein
LDSIAIVYSIERESVVMRKAIWSIAFLLWLVFTFYAEASYLIKLKNGRQWVTSGYWLEGTQVLFYTPGGIAGIDQNEIAGIENYAEGGAPNEVIIHPEKSQRRSDTSTSLPAPPKEQPPSKQTSDEPINLKSDTDKKDRMMAELDGFLEKLREATSRKDNEAKEKIRDEIRKKSGQIYQLTDEVTKKNNGKLPEGWWGK